MNIIGYLLQEWSKKEARQFVNEVEKLVELIKNYPQLFPESQKQKGLRQAVLGPQVSLYYRVKEGYIEILTLLDNRQDFSQLED